MDKGDIAQHGCLQVDKNMPILKLSRVVDASPVNEIYIYRIDI